MATKRSAEKTAPTPTAKMTKTQIVQALAEKLETEPKQVQPFLDALADGDRANARGRRVYSAGLGQAGESGRKERMGRNPSTGEQIKIAAKTTVKFRIARAATDAIAPPKA